MSCRERAGLQTRPLLVQRRRRSRSQDGLSSHGFDGVEGIRRRPLDLLHPRPRLVLRLLAHNHVLHLSLPQPLLLPLLSLLLELPHLLQLLLESRAVAAAAHAQGLTPCEEGGHSERRCMETGSDGLSAE